MAVQSIKKEYGQSKGTTELENGSCDRCSQSLLLLLNDSMCNQNTRTAMTIYRSFGEWGLKLQRTYRRQPLNVAHCQTRLQRYQTHSDWNLTD
ncbi:hypothetical protein TNCV_2104121 [Trichonephila clavipes]|nr:hypothetical protein TNCV_2104121 [Trichonephila clavipes]